MWLKCVIIIQKQGFTVFSFIMILAPFELPFWSAFRLSWRVCLPLGLSWVPSRLPCWSPGASPGAHGDTLGSSWGARRVTRCIWGHIFTDFVGVRHILWGFFVPPCPRDHFFTHFFRYVCQVLKAFFKEGCPGSVDFIRYLHLTSILWQDWGNGVSQMAPSNPKMVPGGSMCFRNGFKVVPTKGSSMVPDDRVMAWVHKYPTSYAKVE
jgi:hypothetical protein